MIDVLLAQTALPNLHPALVHFPVALVPLALLFEAALWLTRGSTALDRYAAALWVLAAASAGSAYLAGERAADGLALAPPAVEAALALHEDWALAALCAIGAVAAVRLAAAWRDRHGGPPIRRSALRGVGLLGAIVALGIVLRTADLGGALVYRHGVGVSASAAEPARPVPSDARNLVELGDGSLLFTPQPDDETSLGRVLVPIGAAPVRVVPSAARGKGLTLAVSGRVLLALPGSWEDGQVEVHLDASDLEGVVGVAARVEGQASGAFLRLRSDGTASLVVVRDGGERRLDEEEIEGGRGEHRIALSLNGQHWRGYVDGKTVAHGHARLRAGRAALLFDGRGTVRIFSARVSPLRSRHEHAQHGRIP